MRAIERLLLEEFQQQLSEAEWKPEETDQVFVYVSIYPPGMTRKRLEDLPPREQEKRWEMPASWRPYWKDIEQSMPKKYQDRAEDIIGKVSYVHIFVSEAGVTNRRGIDFAGEDKYWEWAIPGDKSPFDLFMEWFMNKLRKARLRPRVITTHRATTGGAKIGTGGGTLKRDMGGEEVGGRKIELAPGAAVSDPDIRPGSDLSREILIRINPITGEGREMVDEAMHKIGLRPGDKVAEGIYVGDMSYSVAPKTERERIGRIRRLEKIKIKFADPRMYVGLLPPGVAFEVRATARELSPTPESKEEWEESLRQEKEEKRLLKSIKNAPFLAIANMVENLADRYVDKYDTSDIATVDPHYLIRHLIYDISSQRFSDQYGGEGSLKYAGREGLKELHDNIKQYKEYVKNVSREEKAQLKQRYPNVLSDVEEYVQIVYNIGLDDIHRYVEHYQEIGWPFHVINPHAYEQQVAKQKKGEVELTPEQIAMIQRMGRSEIVLPSQLGSNDDFSFYIDPETESGVIYFITNGQMNRLVLGPGKVQRLLSISDSGTLNNEILHSALRYIRLKYRGTRPKVENIEELDDEARDLQFYHAYVAERRDDEPEEIGSLEDFLATYDGEEN